MKCLKLLIFLICLPIVAQIENEKFKPYYFFGFSNDIPETHNYGGFHYTNIHNTVLDDYFGSFYQSGMMHTWYRPGDIYDLDDYDKDVHGYHAMEGGAGYKPYNRFHNYLTPQKFTMGGVAGGFGAFSNGPGLGAPGFNNSASSSTLRWEEDRGRYGTAVLSNSLLFPLDGIGFEGRANNKMFGYGYYALPLTEPKTVTAGADIPTGNRCWTLFFNTENFSGPVAFHTPYHWSKYSLTNENAEGKCFDHSLLTQSSPIFQRETNTLPAKSWVDANGDIYYKCSPVLMPVDDDGIGRIGTMPMNMDSTMWDELSNWFNGGAIASTNFAEKDGALHIRQSTSGNPYFTFNVNSANIKENDFAVRISDPEDPYAAAFQWNQDLVTPVEGRELVALPEYYVLTEGSSQAIAIPESDVPDESGLKEIDSRSDYEEDWNFNGFNRDPVFTPMHPDFTYSDAIVDVWKSPGPASGPYYTELDDGSTAVYYWYKFNEQPSILNSDMDETERQLIQERVELMHKNWNKNDNYFPEPNKEKVSLDNGLLVTPPTGLEIGYVPVCVHQQLSTEQLPVFPEINLNTAPLKVYIVAGQSNAVGLGQVPNNELPGTLAYTLENDTTGKYNFLSDGTGGYTSQDDAWIYFERNGILKTGELEPGYGNDDNKMGLEVTFGERMQEYTNQQVLIIKAAWGGKNLAVDFRPPSSGGDTGVYYNEILRVVNDALDNLGIYYPDYNANTGYEISGLVWHQGWNDHVNASFTAEYTENLANLINDLRSDIGVDFPVAIATTAMPTLSNTFEENTIYKNIELAQLAIADNSLYPEFEGNVAVVDAKEYWISPTLSPVSSGGQHFHWNQNAKTYMDMGFGLADALYSISDSNINLPWVPDPNKTYYIDNPHHNLRLASTGESEDAYTTNISTTGADVEWKFVSKGNGSWHLQRAAGGIRPRLRSDGSENADMQDTSLSGGWTYYDITQGYIDNTYFLTLPDGPTNSQRLQIDNNGNVKMKATSHAGTWESFTFTETGGAALTLKMEAEDFDAMSGIQVEPNGQGTDNVGFVNNGDWLRFDNINLENITLIDAHVSSATSGGTIEYRLGSTTGTLIGSVNVSGTGGWNSWETVSANVGSFGAVVDLFLVFKGNDGYLLNVDWIELSSGSGLVNSNKSISNNNDFDVSVYPNPVSSIATIKGAANSTISIFSINGKLLFSKHIENDSENIDLSNLSSGIYYLKVNDKLYLSVTKLIKD